MGPAGPLGPRLVGRKSFSQHSWALEGSRNCKSTNVFPKHMWRSLLASQSTPRNNNNVFPEVWRLLLEQLFAPFLGACGRQTSIHGFPQHMWRSLLASHHAPRNNSNVFPGAVAATPGAWLDPMVGQSNYPPPKTNLTFQRL